MEYLSCADVAKSTDTTVRRIQQLCKEGKIKGAIKSGHSWLIPSKENKVNKPLPIGVSKFSDACTNYYYVDKTLLIKDLLDEHTKVTLFTRPRRFGKTLNMDMLRCFFEKTSNDTSIYFKDKKIWECGDEYTKHQGKYPVIFLTLKDVKCLNWEDTFQILRSLISSEFMRHNKLETSNILDTREKEQYAHFADGDINESECQLALKILSSLLHKHYGKECIIVVDEYDAPINQGYSSGFYDKTINFMRNFFSNGFKDNPHLAYGFLTGILRVAKESIFSGLNNLTVNSVLDDKYSEYFGFTKDEVKEMLKFYQKEDKYDEICDWYDGYRFGNTEIFNPWSVICYFNNNCKPRAFWLSTSSNDIIGEVLKHATPDIVENLEALMKGESFLTRIDTGIIYPQIQKDPSSVYSFLLVTGYLKATSSNGAYGEDYMCEVSLPNKEISFVYSKEIVSRIEENISYSTTFSVQEAIFRMDNEKLQKALENFLIQTISYYDTNNETFYHGLVLGMCAITDGNYRIASNRESGLGRFDIQMIPLNKKLPAVIIELKAEKDCKEIQLEKLAKKALEQINDNKYDANLKTMELSSIIKIGIAFSGKNTKIVSEKTNI